MLLAVGSLGKKSKLEPIPSPDLQLNFDQSSIGANAAPDDAIDFSRASQATFTDSDGLVKYAPHNLQLYSEEIDNAVYSKTRMTVSANATTAPNGTTTADKIVEDNTSGSRYYREFFNVVTGQFYTWSGHFKASERNFVGLWSSFGAGLLPVVFTTFNLTTGTIHYNDNDQETATITDEGNGWFRCSITFQATGTGVEDVGVILWDGNGSVTDADNSGFSYTGDGSSGIFAWGMQFSNHKFVPVGNPYIKTTSAAVYGARLDHEAGYFLSANQAQNLILDSETIANASGGWLTTAATANSTDVPSGIGADNSTQITYSANAQVYNLVNNIVAGETYTFSYYVKLGTKSNNKYAVYDDTANAFIVAIAVNTSASASEWTRFSLTVTAPANCDQLRFYVDRADNSGEYGTIFITGVQVEVGSTATTYNQTNGLEYYGGGATQNGLLIEEQRVNIFQYSEEFDNAAWSKSSTITVTANQILSPDGSVNADEVKVTGTPTSAVHVVQDAISVSSGETYTFSCFLKKGQQRYAVLGFDTAVNPQVKGGVDLENGNIITGSDSSTQVEDYGNGWFRCSITATTTSTSGMNCNIFLNDADDVTVIHTPTANDSIYVWGAQVEQGAFPTSYIPTSGSTVTRSADLATMGPVTGTNLILQSEDLSTTWTAIRTSVSANAIASPDGLTTADTLVEDTTVSNNHFSFQNFTLDADKIYVYSFYAKPISGATNRNITVQAQTKANTFPGFIFKPYNLTTGNTFNGGISRGIEDVGNGWVRGHLVFDSLSGGVNGQVYAILHNETSQTQIYTGDGSSGMHIWGAQLEQAPTLITDAEDFTTGWTVTGATITANQIEAPDGNTTADLMKEDSSNGAHRLIKSVSVEGNQPYTFSVFVKAATFSGSRMLSLIHAGAGIYDFTQTNYDLDNGTIHSSSHEISTINDVGNGWFRLTATETTKGAGSAEFRLLFNLSSNSYQGDNASGVYLWGVQIEEGASATPYPPEPTKYLPTYASTNLPFVGYNLNEGTVVADTDMIVETNIGAGAVSRQFSLQDSTTLNDIMQTTTTPSNVGWYVKQGGVVQANFVIGSASGRNYVFKSAVAYKDNDFAGISSGGTLATDTSGTVPKVVDELNIGGQSVSVVNLLNGIIKKFSYWNSRLKNDYLKRLS